MFLIINLNLEGLVGKNIGMKSHNLDNKSL